MTDAPTTPLDRAKLALELDAQATGGPWLDLLPATECVGPRLIVSAVHNEQEAVIMYSRYNGDPWCLPEDRAFIAAARTLLPALARDVEALSARVAELERQLAEADQQITWDHKGGIEASYRHGVSAAAIARHQARAKTKEGEG